MARGAREAKPNPLRKVRGFFLGKHMKDTFNQVRANEATNALPRGRTDQGSAQPESHNFNLASLGQPLNRCPIDALSKPDVKSAFDDLRPYAKQMGKSIVLQPLSTGPVIFNFIDTGFREVLTERPPCAKKIDKQQHEKPSTTHDLKGLTGWWKGMFYKDGRPQKKKI